MLFAYFYLFLNISVLLISFFAGIKEMDWIVTLGLAAMMMPRAILLESPVLFERSFITVNFAIKIILINFAWFILKVQLFYCCGVLVREYLL